MVDPATTTRAPLTAENHLSSPSHTALIEQEHHDPTIKQTHKAQPQLGQPSPPPTSAPPSIPITELRNLSASLAVFQSCFSDLQRHLNHLKTAVDSLITTSPVGNPISTLLPSTNETVEKKSRHVEEEENVIGSQLEVLCEKASGKELKRFIVSNFKEINKLRQELPKALKVAPYPGKLVQEGCGKFFSQGSKAYINKDSPLVIGREASVFLLECFLLMSDGEMSDGEKRVKIEKPEKDEADGSAIVWRKRLIGEGGLAKACEIDARGLLFWIGCFGVPDTFKNKDVIELLHASNAKEVSVVLKRSSVLSAKIQEIIEGMVNKKMAVDAVDLIFTTGFEDKFNPRTMLTTFLRESNESWKGKKQALTPHEQKFPTFFQNEANKKHLANLKSILKCLEGHKIEPSKFISGWSIREKILTLEKDIAEFDKNKEAERTQKRKTDEAERTQKRKTDEAERTQKRSRYLMESSIPSHIPLFSHAPPPAAGTVPYGGGMRVDSGGYLVNHSVQPYGLRGDTILTERPVSSISGLYGSSPSSYAISRRNGASDLYQFADVVVENEYQPPVVSARHNQYLY